MKIGIAGPVLTSGLAHHLEGDLKTAPGGKGGSPVISLANELLLKGYQVSVYSLDTSIETPVVLSGPMLTVYYGPMRKRHHIWDLMKKERDHISAFIRGDCPDLVHAHWTYEYAWGALDSGKPLLVTVHDWAPKIFLLFHDHYRFLRLCMNYHVLSKAENFTVGSEYLREKMRSICKDKSIRLIPNFLSESDFNREDKIQNLCAPVIINFSNGFTRFKNVSALLEAFPIIRKEIRGASLILIGHDFEQGGRAHRWAADRGLDSGVQFAGSATQERVLAYMRGADLLVHPSLEENCCMALTMAMASKLPVIGGLKSGGVPWHLDYGKAGLLTNVRSPEAIAASAIRMLKDNALWRSYSEAGYRHVWEHFRSSKNIDQYIEEYDRIFQHGAKG